jgi:hypothetical protein
MVAAGRLEVLRAGDRILQAVAEVREADASLV